MYICTCGIHMHTYICKHIALLDVGFLFCIFAYTYVDETLIALDHGAWEKEK